MKETYLLTDQESIMECLYEHSQALYNDRHLLQKASLDRIAQQKLKAEVENPPVWNEINITIKQRLSSKVIMASELKDIVMYRFQDLFTSCWEKGLVP